MCTLTFLFYRGMQLLQQRIWQVKSIEQDGAAECTSQQDAFRTPTSILAPAVYIPIIPGLDKSLGSGLSMLSATSENWAKICNEQHSFKPE